MKGQTVPPGLGRRNSLTNKRPPPMSKRIVNGITSEPPSKPSSPPAPHELEEGERTVRKLRLTKALTIPEGTTISEACRRMASRHVDAVLLTDSNALLSGIMTDKDIASRVVAEGLRPDQTLVSKVMTRNPIFVTSDTLAIEALQKMAQGKFRHLPVVENGEVIAILDITRCLYDAIFRMEKAAEHRSAIAAEHRSAIAAAVEEVERQRSGNLSAPNFLLETLREHMFKPPLSTLIGEDTKIAIASAADPVYVAALKMRELRVNSAVVVSLSGTKIQGILTSKDILMRVVAQNLSPELTLVEKVMTPNPDCASLDTTILDALHMMHNGKFLHLPVVDRDGSVAACMDVLQITHAAISLVESSSGTVNDMANTIMQRFWDSAFALELPEDSDTHSDLSGLVTSEGADAGKSPLQSVENSFAFKLEDLNGLVHRFHCGIEHLDEVLSAVTQRVEVNDGERPLITYEDDEGDKIILATDHDLVAAVSYARSAGLKALKLQLEFGNSTKSATPTSDTSTIQKSRALSLRKGIFAGAVVITSIGLMTYLKRSRQ